MASKNILSRRRLLVAGGAGALSVSQSIAAPGGGVPNQSPVRDRLNVRSFGALGDGTADDFAAFSRAMEYLNALSPPGGELLVPAGYYRMSRQLVITSYVRLVGEGWGERPPVVRGVKHRFPFTYYGSVLVFDAGSGGLQFQPHRERERVADADDGVFQNGAYGSSVENLMIVSLDYGASPVARHDGLRSRTRVNLRNVAIIGFSRDGLQIVATSGPEDLGMPEQSGQIYGNANLSRLDDVRCEFNGRHGIFIAGRDANGLTITHPDCRSNGGWGLYMASLLGNTVVGGHFDFNNRLGRASATRSKGSIKTVGAVASHTIVGVYIESAGPGTQGSETELAAPTMLIGAQGAGNAMNPVESAAFVLGNGIATRQGVGGQNHAGSAVVGAMLGRPLSREPHIAFSFGDSEDPVSSDTFGNYRLAYNAFGGGSHSFTLGYRTDGGMIQWVGAGHPRAVDAYGLMSYFPNGLSLGSAGSTACRLLPAAPAPPSSGGAFRAGDTIYNSVVASGQPIGWRCAKAGSPGTWLPMPNMP
ncbi:MAG TPA: glycosyl hydrolase family 28-related protein [Allosphingosinicella sp.]|jgi:hypothetical protein